MEFGGMDSNHTDAHTVIIWNLLYSMQHIQMDPKWRRNVNNAQVSHIHRMHVCVKVVYKCARVCACSPFTVTGNATHIK